MVEENKAQRDITIQLMIKSLTIPVTEQLPVKIIWTRGAKKAETKKRLLSDMAQSTVFDEKFEVSTQMEVDADGKPTRSKMVSTRKNAIDACKGIRLSNFDMIFFVLIVLIGRCQ